MTRAEEVDIKVARVRDLIAREGLGGALFATCANFAWITGGGRSHVSLASERGVGAVLVTADEAVLVADNIERERLLQEELAGLSLASAEFDWWHGIIVEEAQRRVPAASLVADVPLPGCRLLDTAETIALRNPLLAPEIDRYRSLGRDAGAVMSEAALRCDPGLSEHQLAGMLAGGLADFGIQPVVTLVAVDDRVRERRHPLPTDRRLERYAMLVAGARRDGLNVSLTRLVHFGPVPADLSERLRSCARVDAAFLAATRPGAALADIFRAGQAAYAAEGFPDEWREHHQGGPTGYGARDLKACPGCPGSVLDGQAYAWNPSIAGVKSEDTYLVSGEGLELLSPTPDLPAIEAEVGGRRFTRPAIVER